MIVNGKTIYRSAADELYYVQGEDVTFETKDQATWFCETSEILTVMEVKLAMTIQVQKLEKAATVQEWATRLANLDDFLEALNARQFGYDQTNEPTDDDLSELGITRDDYRNGVTLLQAVATATESAAQQAVMARLRTDV